MAGWINLFSHFDEGFLDEVFDLDFEESAKEVLRGSNYSCEECAKVYKIVRGLNKHQLNKYRRMAGDADLDNQIVIDQEVVMELVELSQDKI